jgi:hypothetical protein
VRLNPWRSWVKDTMYPGKLDTRQYTDTNLRLSLRAKRIKVSGQHTIRVVGTTMMVGLAAAWCGSGIAHADSSHEQQACALMGDYGTSIHLGYGSSTGQYALAVLSTEMPPAEADNVLVAATHDDCPNHAADLPFGWH